MAYLIHNDPTIFRVRCILTIKSDNNVNLGGNMFENLDWLPAHTKCHIKCALDSEICQMNSGNIKISKQRCLKRNCLNFFLKI